MHGIVRVQNLKQNSSETSTADIARVIFRYSDGRTLTFVPEAGREDYSEDDMMELVKVLERASSTAEWAEAGSTAARAVSSLREPYRPGESSSVYRSYRS